MSGYESPSSDAREYEFRLNTPSPSEMSTNFEVSRAAVREVAGYVSEIENAKLITGVRMAIFGSSVAEPTHVPSDIDVFLIYESLEKPFIEPFHWRGEDGSLSENALKIYKGINSKGRNLELTFGEPESSMKTTHPHHVNLVTVSRNELLATLKRDPQRNRLDYLNFLENTALLADCVPDPTKPELLDLARLMPVFAKSWEEIQIKQPDENSKGKLYEVSKKLRSSFECYIDGRNFIQTAIGNGAVLIKGESLLDQNQQPVFTKTDNEFLN